MVGENEKAIPELVEQFIAGDNRAFAELVRRYRKKIYSIAYRMLGNHLDADEVVQESFVRVYRRRRELTKVTNFTSFLIRVATNYTIDLLRKRRIQSAVAENPDDLPGPNQLDLAAKNRRPDELYQDKVIMQEIKNAMETLPPRQKLTVTLHDLEGLTKAEIASVMECPEATVRSNLHIARMKLKAALKSRLNDPETK